MRVRLSLLSFHFTWKNYNSKLSLRWENVDEVGVEVVGARDKARRNKEYIETFFSVYALFSRLQFEILSDLSHVKLF